jgi:hypothetical protein
MCLLLADAFFTPIPLPQNLPLLLRATKLSGINRNFVGESANIVQLSLFLRANYNRGGPIKLRDVLILGARRLAIRLRRKCGRSYWPVFNASRRKTVTQNSQALKRGSTDRRKMELIDTAMNTNCPLVPCE